MSGKLLEMESWNVLPEPHIGALLIMQIVQEVLYLLVETGTLPDPTNPCFKKLNLHL